MDTGGSDTTEGAVAAFIEYWADSGGSELANAQPFVIALCKLLGVDGPAPSKEENAYNDYVFERRVSFKHADGSTTPGRIDCYKRDHFILEAKQSAKRQVRKLDSDQMALLPEDATQVKLGTAKRDTRGWDKAMIAARKQAEDYARALPVDHGYPPFLLVVDVGHVIEVFADFSGQGKNYAHFPDRQSYRIPLAELAKEDVRTRLKAIWQEPLSLDPTRISAEVTRDVAERLARIARGQEGKHHPEKVAAFLMRCLFTMFAEDVGLLPKDAFAELLAEMEKSPAHFAPAMEALWKVMDEGGYAPQFNEVVKRFNGTLFKDRSAIPLSAEDIHELWVAAKRDWKDVEPAIFGTLLEQALDKRERAKLGAHYTPRAYVERVVIPTVIEPLRDEWEEVQARAQELRDGGKLEDAQKAVKAFHHTLCTTRVLDPACGTGNFLYVSLELMKRLEGEVLDALDDLGEDAPRLAMSGETVDPSHFYGLEVNPRAVPIADLVLWLGYLKWQLRTTGLASLPEPVLRATDSIKQQDAILAYDDRELIRDENGKPVTVWDGHTYKPHPVTGNAVPDETARQETYRYTKPRKASWPEAEFIVGNPPFIGGKDIRAELGDGYAEAIWEVRPHIPGGADFVMHFWDQAAEILLAKNSKLRRFGFITTNSVTQTFSRRVIERHLNAKKPLSLVFAVPNHPWLKQAGKAAVRIAMTVAEKGRLQGVIAEVRREEGLNSDTPKVELEKREGKIQANLRIGADLSQVTSLLSNKNLSSPGIKLHGAGFIVTEAKARELGLGRVRGLEDYILDYRNGRDLTQRPRGVKVIDLYSLSAEQVRDHFPSVYQHVHDYVKPERDHNNRAYRREGWWLFGENIPEARKFLFSVPRYIATVETSKHRFFQFLDASIRPDNMLVNIGLESAEHLAVLSSRLHVAWAISAGGWLGAGNDPRYSKTRTFDPFPFPVFETLDPRLVNRLRDLGERLDAFRKERLAAYSFLTMTGLYNVMERLRELEDRWPVPILTEKEKDVHDAGLVSVLMEIHNEIDAAVLEAYGWNDLADALVGKPGGTTPSQHKVPEQEEAEEELLTRIVTLNQERAAEEKRGVVHWLRPEFQVPKLGHKVKGAAEQLEADIGIAEDEAVPSWPGDGLAQIRVVRDLLTKAQGPVAPDSLAEAFSGRNTAKRKERIGQVLETLTETGAIRRVGEGGADLRYFLPR